MPGRATSSLHLPLIVELTPIDRLRHLHQGNTPLSYDVALQDGLYVFTLCLSPLPPSNSVGSPTVPLLM